MSLDFRKLKRKDQVKALDNLYRIEGKCNDYLARLITKERYNVYDWFSFSLSKEGAEYWINLSNKINKEQ